METKDTTRRGFFQAAGGIAAVSAAIGMTSRTVQGVAEAGMVTEHTLAPLPYAYDALEPLYDEQTLRLHHDKHHAGYVRGLNAAEEALAEARASGDFGAIQSLSRKSAFHGGGHFLHSLFWATMAPPGKGGGGEPEGALAEALERDFGSVEAFRAQMSAASKGVEGSGWGILAVRPGDGRLLVFQAENHQKLSPWNVVPILCVDVWEHAYYLNYQNKRGDYIQAYWNVIDWGFVQQLFEEAVV